jgi:hypothetical protein
VLRLAACLAGVLLAAPAAAAAHERDDLASVVRAAPRGVAVEVLGGADHLALRNETRRVVTVLGAGRAPDVRVAPGGRAEWHDPRAVWSGSAAPEAVGSAPVRVGDWRIPLRVGSRRQAIRGEMFLVRQSGAGAWLPLVVAALALALVGGALAVVRRVGRRA